MTLPREFKPSGEIFVYPLAPRKENLRNRRCKAQM